MNPFPEDNPPPAFTVSEPHPQLTPLNPDEPPCLGSVPYLNARPLTYAIAETVVLLEPSRLVVELAEGRLHAAVAPIVEVLEKADAYHIVNGVAIGSLTTLFRDVLTHALAIIPLRTISLEPDLE